MEQEPIARTALDEMVESDQNQNAESHDPVPSFFRAAVFICVYESPGTSEYHVAFSKQP